jgi:hypothetical protein
MAESLAERHDVPSHLRAWRLRKLQPRPSAFSVAAMAAPLVQGSRRGECGWAVWWVAMRVCAVW